MTAIALDQKTITTPDWEQAVQLLDRLLSGKGAFLQMFGPDEAMMTIASGEEFGFYVSAYGKGELEEHLLIEPELGMSRVDADIGGGSDGHPRCVLVSRDTAMRAAREFYESGRRMKDLCWGDPFKLYADAGIA